MQYIHVLYIYSTTIRHTRDLKTVEGDVVRMRPFMLNKKTWDKASSKLRLNEQFYKVEANDSTD